MAEDTTDKLDTQGNPLLRQTRDSYKGEYDKALLEQYKLYVEMADRVSARRMLANSFFLAVHTALVTTFTVLLKERIMCPSIVGMLPFAAVLLLCIVWFSVVRSYKQLNSGKFRVIHAFEELLPCAPYDTEWDALGRGKDSKLYRPLTHVETYVPLCFGLLYLLLAIGLCCT